jgi:hypothetical protein
MIWIFVRRDYGALEYANCRRAFGITQGTTAVDTTTDGRHRHCRWQELKAEAQRSHSRNERLWNFRSWRKTDVTVRSLPEAGRSS